MEQKNSSRRSFALRTVTLFQYFSTLSFFNSIQFRTEYNLNKHTKFEKMQFGKIQFGTIQFEKYTVEKYTLE